VFPPGTVAPLDGVTPAGRRPIQFLARACESRSAIEGRTFDSSDDAEGLKTALVSRSLAGEQWPGRSPLGETVEVSFGDATTERRVIVGVVGDITLDPAGMTAAGNSAIYVPFPQRILPTTQFTVRHRGEETVARSAMYEALARIDPTIAPNIQTYDWAIEQVTLFSRTIMKLFAGAARSRSCSRSPASTA
jgi:hypothetical protein